MASIKDKLSNISLLLLDVDGVLTNGQVIYDDDGKQTQIFNVKDGLGIRLMQESNLEVGIITGRSSQALLHRCHNLGIDLLFDGIRDKLDALKTIIKKRGIETDKIAFVGDDLPDLPVMGNVGLSIAVADAHPIVKNAADMVTRAAGGNGAVREVCEAILKANGMYDSLIKKLLSNGKPNDRK